MKKLLIALVSCMLVGLTTTSGQIEFHPQIGVNFASLSEDPRIFGEYVVETEGRGGILLGADLRIGDRIYLQPGLFVLGSKTVYSFQDSLFVDPQEVKRFDGKLKGLVGVKIIDSAFKLRAMAGPTYNFNLNLDADDSPYFDKDEFKAGYFNIDAGIGVDISILTAEIGYSFALTDVFDNDVFENKPKYQTIYATIGIVIGN
jgi:hypothetical protein